MKGLAFVILAVVVLLGIGRLSAQDSVDIRDVHYEPVTQDFFSDYPHAKLIVNYYCSEGWSVNDRYSFEVVLIDSLLMLGFESPGTETMRYISYQKRTVVSQAFVDTVKNLLGRAGLTQVKQGIPKPVAAANTKEVLIIKYATINIAGGLFYNTMIQEDASQEKINAMIQRERKLTSSIGGDYESVMLAMKSYFTELNNLTTEVLKYKK
jgi:hypothetical protein